MENSLQNYTLAFNLKFHKTNNFNSHQFFLSTLHFHLQFFPLLIIQINNILSLLHISVKLHSSYTFFMILKYCFLRTDPLQMEIYQFFVKYNDYIMIGAKSLEDKKIFISFTSGEEAHKRGGGKSRQSAWVSEWESYRWYYFV